MLKTKTIGTEAANLIPMVYCLSADVGKWLNPPPLQRGALRLRGFESRRLQHKAPVEAATSSRAVITTAEAMATRNPIMGFLAVDLNWRFHSDLPQLQIRMPEIW